MGHTVLACSAVDCPGLDQCLPLSYVLNNPTYMSAPELVWQKAKAPLHYSNPQFDEFYTGWARDTALSGKADSVHDAIAVLHFDVVKFGGFFLFPELAAIVREMRSRGGILLGKTDVPGLNWSSGSERESHWREAGHADQKMQAGGLT